MDGIAGLRLLGDVIAVRPMRESEEKSGSLHLPMTTKDARGFARHLDGAVLRGRVVACGPGDALSDRRRDGTYRWLNRDHSRRPMKVKVGDLILYPHRGGEIHEVNGEKLLFFHEEQFVLGVIEE
jgi:co-chaperonin GroES (HSP10)